MALLNNPRLTQLIDIIIRLYGEYLIYFQIASLFISAILLSLIIYAGARSKFLSFKLEPLVSFIGIDEFSQRKSTKAWAQVERRMAEGGEANVRLAIIEADKILDVILKLSGFKGDTLGERLKQISAAQIANIEDIWRVHKLRNRIVHDPDYKISREDTVQGIEVYKKALQQLALLD